MDQSTSNQKDGGKFGGMVKSPKTYKTQGSPPVTHLSPGVFKRNKYKIFSLTYVAVNCLIQIDH